MKKWLVPILIILSSTLLSEDEETIKLLRSHLLIKDYDTICHECERKSFSEIENEDLFMIHIEALAKSKKEKELIKKVQEYSIKCGEGKIPRDVYEILSWGIIENGVTSPSPIIRLYALLAAFFSNDARGIEMIKCSMRDSNFLIRSLAIQLSRELPDLKIQNELLCLIKREPLYKVRLLAIKAFGALKSDEIKNLLENIISDDEREHEEKIHAIKSLVEMMELAKREDIQILAQSKRMGCRLLAIELVLNQNLVNDLDLIYPLLKDPHFEVRKKTLELVATFRINLLENQELFNEVERLIKDKNSIVGVTGAYLLMLNDPEKGQEALKKFLIDQSNEVRLIAASALAKAGKYGFPLIEETFKESKDSMIKANLSFGLLGQRKLIHEACSFFYDFVTKEKEPIQWNEEGFFRYLSKSIKQTTELGFNETESKDLFTRLEILNILCVMQDSRAESAIRKFLQDRNFGVSLMASLLLLTEADDSAAIYVQNLLKDPNEKIRMQAALILSLWNAEGDAVKILEDAYENADRELKERILESIGRIGSESSIPFLLKAMQEPFQLLRLIAASSLLQILDH